MRNQGKSKYATNLLSLFHIKDPAAAHTMKGGQLTAISKPKANNVIRAQAHHQTSQELFFIVSLTIFGKRKESESKVVAGGSLRASTAVELKI